MKKTEKNEIMNATTIAVYYCGNAFQSLEIKRIEYGIDVLVVYVFTHADGHKSAHKSIVHTETENFYFDCYPLRRRVPLNECLRV